MGFGRGTAVLWAGALVGLDYLKADKSRVISLAVRGQLLLIGAEVAPLVVIRDAPVPTIGVRPDPGRRPAPYSATRNTIMKNVPDGASGSSPGIVVRVTDSD